MTDIYAPVLNGTSKTTSKEKNAAAYLEAFSGFLDIATETRCQKSFERLLAVASHGKKD